MNPKGPTLFEETVDVIEHHVDRVDKINKKVAKWYFVPSVLDFLYLLNTTVKLLQVALTSAKVIDSNERIIADQDREIARLEREISRLNEQIVSNTIKNQAKEEK